MPKREEVIAQTEYLLNSVGLKIVSRDMNRPWGGFFVLDEGQAETFINLFFNDLKLHVDEGGNRISPKILFVRPRARLSWQYHHRRSEVWTVVVGPAGVKRSETDEEGEIQRLEKGDQIVLNKGERHRLIGFENWAVIAEIWKHSDRNHLSDENDIVRLQDDYGR